MAGEFAEDDKDPEVIIEDDKPEGEATPEGDDKPEGEEDEKPAAKKKRRRGNPAPAQVNNLLWKVREAEDRAAAAQRELEQERASRLKMEGITAQSLEKSLTSEGQSLTQQLRDAHSEQDADKIAKVTAEISRVEAQKAQLERFRVEKDARPQAPAEKPTSTQETQSESMSFDDLYDTGSQAMRGWLDSNRDWFHPDSDNYSEEMVQDVTNLAKRVEQDWSRTGRGAEIGTRAYFKYMDKYIADNWSNEEEVTTPKPPTQRAGFAAPVNNRQAPGTKQPAAREAIKIESWERDVAINTPLKHPDGRNFTDEEKIKQYASNKKIMAANPVGQITVNMLRKS